VVTSIDGHEVNSEQGLRFRLATHKIGDSVPLKVIRDGVIKNLRLKAHSAPENPRRSETVLDGINPFAGAKIANLSPALAEELSMDAFAKGVIILSVAPRSPASYYGLRPGDIIGHIADEPVKSVADMQRILKVNDGARRWPVTIVRGGRETSATIRLRS